MSAALLSISIVIYRLDAGTMARLLRQLRAAVSALARVRDGGVRITIIDNGHDAAELRMLLQRSGLDDLAEVISAGSNVGYGRAHNLAIAQSTATYHLVMNPDVLVAEDSLIVATAYLDTHPDVAALSPHAVDGAGAPAFLCKRYPAVFDLALRGFAPKALRSRFDARLHRYENRELVTRGEASDVDIISGCFMFCRTTALRQAGGFNPRYFLYFEDFSLSLELHKYGRLVYLPACRITHFGGHAGKKGLRHIVHFSASALKFYRQYGWKLL